MAAWKEFDVAQPSTRREAAEHGHAPRQDRIEARLTAEQKALIGRAAALEGMSISSFVVQRALDAALQSIERRDVLKLSMRDSERIAEALINSSDPAPALQLAADRHRSTTDSNR